MDPALLDKDPLPENSAHKTMLETSQTTTSGREPSSLLYAKLVICQTRVWLGKQIGAIDDLFSHSRTVRRCTGESSLKLAWIFPNQRMSGA